MKRNKIYNRVLNFLFVNQHIIIVLSSKFRENLKDSFPKLENKKILVSKTIVNTKKYSFNRNYDRKTFRLLFCGEIKHSKGVFLVYDCFKDISNSYGNIELFIMGKGDSEKELIDKIIADKSNKVKYFGYLNSKQKKVVYKSSDLFVFPSYHKEGFPNVISEACAAGLPIIAMDSGGVSEGVLGKHNGYLLQNFKPNNKKINILLDSQGKLKYDISASIVEEMKNHIVKLMENKDLYKKMSYNSLQLSKEKFGIEVIFRQLENSYKKIFHL